MKTTYRIDSVGRIVIPAHMKKKLGLTNGSLVTIDQNGQNIIIRNAMKRCFICGKEIKKPSDMIAVSGNDEMHICPECAKKVEEESKKRGG